MTSDGLGFCNTFLPQGDTRNQGCMVGVFFVARVLRSDLEVTYVMGKPKAPNRRKRGPY